MTEDRIGEIRARRERSLTGTTAERKNAIHALGSEDIDFLLAELSRYKAAVAEARQAIPTEATISDTIAHAWNEARRQTAGDGKNRSVVGVAAKAVHDLLCARAAEYRNPEGNEG